MNQSAGYWYVGQRKFNWRISKAARLGANNEQRGALEGICTHCAAFIMATRQWLWLWLWLWHCCCRAPLNNSISQADVWRMKLTDAGANNPTEHRPLRGHSKGNRGRGRFAWSIAVIDCWRPNRTWPSRTWEWRDGRDLKPNCCCCYCCLAIKCNHNRTGKRYVPDDTGDTIR